MELFIIFLLIILNAGFSLSEFAIVSSRPARIALLKKRGSSSARIISQLKLNMGSLLASIQIGITGVGVLAGVFGGASFSEDLASVFVRLYIPLDYARHLSFGLIVAIITFLSIFLGELVPKQMALANPEKIALLCAKPMAFWVKICGPLVQFLDILTGVFFKIFALEKMQAPYVTEEEVKMLVEQGAQAGVFGHDEETIIKRAITIGDRRVVDLMTPRVDLISIDMKKGLKENLDLIAKSPHSYYPFFDQHHKKILGLLSSKKVLQHIAISGLQGLDLKECLYEPLIFPESMLVLNALQSFKKQGQHYAVVVDEHGDFSGIFGLFDLFEGIVGTLPTGTEKYHQHIIKRIESGFLVDGATPIYEFLEFFQIVHHNGEHSGYSTVAGLVLEVLDAIPSEGQCLFWKNLKIEIIDMDGNRIDKLLITPQYHGSD